MEMDVESTTENAEGIEEDIKAQDLGENELMKKSLGSRGRGLFKRVYFDCDLYYQ